MKVTNCWWMKLRNGRLDEDLGMTTPNMQDSWEILGGCILCLFLFYYPIEKSGKSIPTIRTKIKILKVIAFTRKSCWSKKLVAVRQRFDTNWKGNRFILLRSLQGLRLGRRLLTLELSSRRLLLVLGWHLMLCNLIYRNLLLTSLCRKISLLSWKLLLSSSSCSKFSSPQLLQMKLLSLLEKMMNFFICPFSVKIKIVLTTCINCCRWYSRASLSRSMMVSNSSKCRNLISNFFICVSTSRATRLLIFRSSTAAKCLAFTAAEERAVLAALWSWPSLINLSLAVSEGRAFSSDFLSPPSALESSVSFLISGSSFPPSSAFDWSDSSSFLPT